MRSFPVPIQLDDEERIIGGKLSLRQILYIITGLAVGGASFGLVFLPVLARLFLFFIMNCFGLVFAFVKIHELRADQYLYLYLKWRRSPRALYLKGEN